MGHPRLTAYLTLLLTILLAQTSLAEKRRTPNMRMPLTGNADQDEGLGTIDDWVSSMTNGGNVRYTRWWRDLPTLAPPLPLSRDGHAFDRRSQKPVEVLCLDCVPGSNPALPCTCDVPCGLDPPAAPCVCDQPCGAICVNDGQTGTPGPGKAPNEVGWRCDLTPAGECFECADLAGCTSNLCTALNQDCVVTNVSCESVGNCGTDICATVAAECPGATDCPPPFCNVKCFGAVGDGVTDDTVAIQAAADGCAVPGPSGYNAVTHTGCQGGGIVFFPRTEKGYRTTATIEGCGVSFMGEGIGASILLPDDFGTCAELDVGGMKTCAPALLAKKLDETQQLPSFASWDEAQAGGVFVRDLCIHGPAASMTDFAIGTQTMDTDGVHFQAALSQNDWSVDHVHIAGMHNGIFVPNFSRGSLRYSTLEFNYVHVLFGGSGDTVLIASNELTDAAWAAIALEIDLLNATILSNRATGVPYFIYQWASPLPNFLGNVTIEDQDASVGNGFIFTENFNESAKGIVQGIHLKNLGAISRSASFKIPAKGDAYMIDTGPLYGQNDADFGGLRALGTGTAALTFNTMSEGSVGFWRAFGIPGTMEMRVKDLATAGVTLTTTGLAYRWHTCDIAGFCYGEGIRTLVDLDATPSVFGSDVALVANTGATTITALQDGRFNQRLTLICTEANTTFTDGGTLRLNGGFTCTADDTLTLVFDGTNWLEVSRSVN